MKIIFSRKGFDSSSGGCPSPIFTDGSMVSFPIPGRSRVSYGDVQTSQGDMGSLVQALAKGKVRSRSPVHLDPDLSAGAMPRIEGWLPSLGQTSAAQSHLDGQGVGVGDVFVFFGWFREAEKTADGGWRYRPGSKDRHVMFGYLQIGESLRVGANPDMESCLVERPWLKGHPHLHGQRDDNNTIHVAAQGLSLDPSLPGAAAFPAIHEDLVLSAPGHSKSIWQVPEWLYSGFENGVGMSYHNDVSRWSRSEDGTPLLQTVAKGQEFVVDCQSIPEATEWLSKICQHARVHAPSIKLKI